MEKEERVRKETQKPSLKPQKLNNSDPILEENDDGEETEEDREEREDEENEDNERIDEEFFF